MIYGQALVLFCILQPAHMSAALNSDWRKRRLEFASKYLRLRFPLTFASIVGALANEGARELTPTSIQGILSANSRDHGGLGGR